MKPLTIEELKALPVGDWVWIVRNNETSGRYYEKRGTVGMMPSYRYFFAQNHGVYNLDYDDYGTKWLAYKNKEQVEGSNNFHYCPLNIGDTYYALVSCCYECKEDSGDHCSCKKFLEKRQKIVESKVKEIVFCKHGGEKEYYVLNGTKWSVSEHTYGKNWFIDKKQAKQKLLKTEEI